MAKESYRSPYRERIDALLRELMESPGFSYDMNADALYRQYRDAYAREGWRAMEDAMGQASALTGGYGNSYAATAGQQAYQNAMASLQRQALALYDRALEATDKKRSRALQNLEALGRQEDGAYARHRDDVADLKWQAGFDYRTRKAGKWRKKHPRYYE